MKAKRHPYNNTILAICLTLMATLIVGCAGPVAVEEPDSGTQNVSEQKTPITQDNEDADYIADESGDDDDNDIDWFGDEYTDWYGDDWSDDPGANVSGGCIIEDTEDDYFGDADVPQDSEGLTYKSIDYGKGYAVTGMGTCRDTELVIPAWYEGKPVTKIADEAFANTWITSVTIPYSITSFGKKIFNNCQLLTTIYMYSAADFNTSGFGTVSSLSDIYYYSQYVGELHYGMSNPPVSVHLSDDTMEIGAYAFMACNVSDVDFGHGLMMIGDNSFNQSPIKAVDLPESLMSIGAQAFYQSSLQRIVIPDSVRVVGASAFYECADLTYAELSAGMTEVPKEMLCHCLSLTEVKLPSTITKIRTYAFYTSENLKKINIPAKVTTIEHGAFGFTAIESMVLPDTVRTLGTYVFSNCRALQTLVLPKGLTEIPEGLCMYSGLNSITIPAGVEKIGDVAFYRCLDLSDVTILSTYVTTSDPAFKDCPCYR